VVALAEICTGKRGREEKRRVIEEAKVRKTPSSISGADGPSSMEEPFGTAAGGQSLGYEEP
jgi:hypothetical protein